MKFIKLLLCITVTLSINASDKKNDEKKPKEKTEKENSDSRDFKFVIGINGYASTLDVNGMDYEMSGVESQLGIAKYVEQSRFRISFIYEDIELDEIKIGNETFKIDTLGTELKYTGYGIELAYNHFFNDKFGLGGHIKYTEGDIDTCINFNCSEVDGKALDIGIRLDFKVQVWTPYISIGRSSITDHKGTYSGISAYASFINFEF